MFGPIGGIVPGVFPVAAGQLLLGESFRAGPISVRHVGIVVEASPKGMDQPSLVQAMPGGAEEIVMSTATHWTDRHAYVRLPEDYPGQAKNAATIARQMVAAQVRYSFASYAALAAWKWGIRTPHLEHWINRRRPGFEAWNLPDWQGRAAWIELPCEAICSVLADQAWSLAGKRIMHGVAHQAVTPGAMASELFRRTLVTWGGKGFVG